MGTCNCSNNQLEKLSQVDFDRMENIDEEKFLLALKTNFDDSINSISTSTQEDFNQAIEAFPNAKELLEKYESKITAEQDSLMSSTNFSLHPSPKEREFIKLPCAYKFIGNEDTKDYYQGYIDKNYNITGRGTYITNNYIYSGYFNNYIFKGKGLMIYKDGSNLFGDWVNGKCTGKGVLKMVDKIEYEGDFVENKMEGHGIEKYPDGSIFEGEFKNNKKNGKGKCTLEHGETYEGDFKNDLFDGEGTYKWPEESRVYTGQFKMGNIEGKGISKYKDGSTYEGNYKNGQKNGTGKYSWPDGKVYYGKWLNNKLHGNGLYDKGNEKYNMTFRFGKNISIRQTEDENKINKNEFQIFLPDKDEDYNIKFYCNICKNILNKPKKCIKCSTNYCSKCIADGEKYKNCIKCQGVEYESNPDLIKELEEAKITCKICKKNFDYENCLNHYHE